MGKARTKRKGTVKEQGCEMIDSMTLICKIQILLVMLGLAAFGVLFILEVTDSSAIDPVPLEYKPIPFKGALRANKILQRADRIFEGQLKGAESLVSHEGHLYSGTSDGRILDIYDNEISTLAILGRPPCGTHAQEKTCGRPLGMRMSRDGRLIVVDSYLGLFKVNISTGEAEKVFEADHRVGGIPLRYMNDVAESRDGKLYLTDSSTKWTRAEGMDLITEGRPTGRLFSYDPSTNKTELLLTEMYGANGVQLSPNEDFLLVTESPKCRILRYWLKGPRAGSTDLFTSLPGFPDNIRPSQSGGYWVAMAIVFQPDDFPAYSYFTTYPTLRKVMQRIFGANFMLKLIRSFYGLIIEVDAEGYIIRSLHDPTGQVVPAVSEVLDQDGKLTLGSFFSPYMLQIDTKML